jgi:hypothetical protein
LESPSIHTAVVHKVFVLQDFHQRFYYLLLYSPRLIIDTNKITGELHPASKLQISSIYLLQKYIENNLRRSLCKQDFEKYFFTNNIFINFYFGHARFIVNISVICHQRQYLLCYRRVIVLHVLTTFCLLSLHQNS